MREKRKYRNGYYPCCAPRIGWNASPAAQKTVGKTYRTPKWGESEVRNRMMVPGIGLSSKGVGSATPSGRVLLGCCIEACILPYLLRSQVEEAAVGCWCRQVERMQTVFG